MATSALIAMWLWARHSIPRILGLPISVAAIILFIVTILCQSGGSILLLICLMPFIFVKRRYYVRTLAVFLVFGILCFAGLRLANVVSIRAVVKRHAAAQSVASFLKKIGRGSFGGSGRINRRYRGGGLAREVLYEPDYFIIPADSVAARLAPQPSPFGGFTVRGALNYGWVMGHFALSMLIILAATALAWRASHGPPAPEREHRLGAPDAKRGRVGERAVVLSVRALVALGALTIFAGTAATAAGPHAGGSPGQRINRLSFDGRATMDFVIHRHGEIALAFGLAAVLVWWLARRRSADPGVRRALTTLCVLLALQGAVGIDQYATHLPTARARPGVDTARCARGRAHGGWLIAPNLPASRRFRGAEAPHAHAVSPEFRRFLRTKCLVCASHRPLERLACPKTSHPRREWNDQERASRAGREAKWSAREPGAADAGDDD